MASNEAVNGRWPFRNRLLSRRNRNKRTYIMPSGFGVAFGTMTLVLFFMAVGYSNNLIYIFVFFLISVGFTGILVTNKNMQNVEFENLRAVDLFATEEGTLYIGLHNPAASPSWEVEARFEKSDIYSDRVSFPSFTRDELKLDFTPAHRGLQKLPRLIIQSTFPFGLLRAWKVIRLESEILVYPDLSGDGAFPQDSIAGDSLQNQGLFRDHRVFQSADPISRVDWKASARRQELLVKNYEEPEKPTLNFHWDQTAHIPNYEEKISQLALWIDEAERTGHTYSLHLETQELAPNQGVSHWRECLGVLALLPRKERA